MTLTYNETNKKLSMIAAILLVLAGLLDVFGTILIEIVMWVFFAGGSIVATLLNSILPNILFWLCQLGIVAALFLRKKNTVTAALCAIPLVFTIIIRPLLLYIVNPILFGYGLSGMLLDLLVDAFFFIPSILFCVALVFNCFTKGKMFGEKAGIVLLVLGILTYLAAVLYPVAEALASGLWNSLVYLGGLHFSVIFRSLDPSLSLITAIPIVLVALAFFRPNQEQMPSAETEEEAENAENDENAEENEV